MAHHVSVFVENHPGKLEKLTALLFHLKIKILAISVANAGEFGVVKVLVNHPEKAYHILKENHFTVFLKEILIIEHTPGSGGLYSLLTILSEENVNVEDFYGFIMEGQNRFLTIIEEGKYPQAKEILKSKGFSILTDKDINIKNLS